MPWWARIVVYLVILVIGVPSLALVVFAVGQSVGCHSSDSSCDIGIEAGFFTGVVSVPALLLLFVLVEVVLAVRRRT